VIAEGQESATMIPRFGRDGSWRSLTKPACGLPKNGEFHDESL
jgi:hypothetical protein